MDRLQELPEPGRIVSSTRRERPGVDWLVLAMALGCKIELPEVSLLGGRGMRPCRIPAAPLSGAETPKSLWPRASFEVFQDFFESRHDDVVDICESVESYPRGCGMDRRFGRSLSRVLIA